MRPQKRRGWRSQRAQTSAEYIVLALAAAFALTSMFSYIRSAASGRMKSGVDAVGNGMLYAE